MSDFNYDLPDSSIAKYPLEKRDESKILIAYKNQEIIKHDLFKNITQHLPKNSSLYFNKTKVISGRFHLKKETGGRAELLLVDPIEPSNDPQISLQATEKTVWKALIGGKRIREGTNLIGDNDLKITILKKNRNEVNAEITWPEGTFSDLLMKNGELPLPPYLNRKAEEKDKDTYQTVFAKTDGSIAAPTAGLHFTNQVLEDIDNLNISRRELTLHVGPGTFLPVKDGDVSKHDMHSEMIQLDIKTLKNIKKDLESNKVIITVGTTSMRTLESLFWLGNNLNEFSKTGIVRQWSPYEDAINNSPVDAINNIISYLEDRGLEKLDAKTKIIIVPGYEFKIVDGLFTNFHIPQSTLLLLVSAFIGEMWKGVYDEALKKDFRMLSYGDTSLLFR